MEVKILKDVLMTKAYYYDVPEGTTEEELLEMVSNGDIEEYFEEADSLYGVDWQEEFGAVEVNCEDLEMYGEEYRVRPSIFEAMRMHGVTEEQIKLIWEEL